MDIYEGYIFDVKCNIGLVDFNVRAKTKLAMLGILALQRVCGKLHCKMTCVPKGRQSVNVLFSLVLKNQGNNVPFLPFMSLAIGLWSETRYTLT